MSDDSPSAPMRWLLARVTWVMAHAGAVLSVTTLLSVVFGWYAFARLGFDVDPNRLFDEMRFQRLEREMAKHFPTLTDAMFVLVEAESPERTREATVALAARLRALPDEFARVYTPAEYSYFERQGLLYLEIDELEEFADQMVELQPLIGELSEEASLVSLSELVGNGFDADNEIWTDEERWSQVLDRFRDATAHANALRHVPVSWESLMLGDSAFAPGLRRVIVLEPILDFGDVLAAGPAIERIRDEADALGLDDVRVRITGYPALNYEEMLGLIWDVGVAGFGSLVLVLCVLSLAFRSGPFVQAAGFTLVTGLIWTAAFTTATVGAVNGISIAFAVLFVGLGIDFMIHLGLHIREAIAEGHELEEAVRASTREIGAALLLCAMSTAVGFLSFVPTRFRGLSDLGVIAGGGMIVIVIQTFTLFPALLKLRLGPDAVRKIRSTPPWRVPMFPVARRPAIVCGIAAFFALGGVIVAPQVELETDVVALRDAGKPSVAAFQDLLDSEDASPWFIDVIAPSFEQARVVSGRLADLEVVERSVTLADYVPGAQDEKLDILADVAMMLEIPDDAATYRGDASDDARIAALRDLSTFLERERSTRADSPVTLSLALFHQELNRFLERLSHESDPGPVLDALEQSLLSYLPEQLARLRLALEPEPIVLANLPSTLTDRMVSEAGPARIQVFPQESLQQRAAMDRFVDDTRTVWEEVTGLPVNLVDSARATTESLLRALTVAVAAIVALLLVVWRNPRQMLLVMGPLLLAAGLTVVATIVLGIPFNFGNIVVLPLLLGVGVDSSVHLVQRSSRDDHDARELLESTTAQGVFYSAITTVASFGSLALANHQGVASLGKLLAAGMLISLVCTLVVLPSLLTLTRGRAAR